MKSHPFQPLIYPNTKIILVGTLPPESAKFYFSNSSNTRLWDILFSIANKNSNLSHGSNELENIQKEQILQTLNLGITDIILKYERDIENSTKDKHIDPKEYNNLLNLILGTEVEQILFLYKNAAKWFLHSLTEDSPKRVSYLKYKLNIGDIGEIIIGGKTVHYSVLPPPLNRGSKGENLNFKLEFYKKYIGF